VIEVGGRKLLIDQKTGDTIKDLGEARLITTKVDTLTADEWRKLYPDLPPSLIGTDEKQVISDLNSPIPPQWFYDLFGITASSVATKERWDDFREKVLGEMREQSQKKTSTTNDDVPAWLTGD